MKTVCLFAWLFTVSLAGWIALGPAPVCAQDARHAASDGFPRGWYFDGRETDALRRIEGQPAPEIDSVSWIGPSQSLRSLRGKIVVLELWAGWCQPSNESLAVTAQLQRRFADKDVQFLAIHDGSDIGAAQWEAAQKLAGERRVSFPIGLDANDPDKSVVARCGATFFPAIIVIDAKGVVRVAGVMPERLEEVVERMLASDPGAGAATIAEFPASVYQAGDARLDAWRELEGKQAPALTISDWIGAERSIGDGAGMLVLHFFSITNLDSVKRLRELSKLKEELDSQGATILAIATPIDDWEEVKKLAAAEGWGITIARDEPIRAGGKGKTAGAFGTARHTPTLLIDQKGVIRAAGLRPVRVSEAARHVAKHAEPTLMVATDK